MLKTSFLPHHEGFQPVEKSNPFSNEMEDCVVKVTFDNPYLKIIFLLIKIQRRTYVGDHKRLLLHIK